MTQQPYYPPAAPPAPAQYPQQPGYPQQQQPYAQPGYAPQPQYQQPQAPPPPPLATGGLDEFYSQPSAGGGPGISWQDKAGNQRPIGTTFVGVVARDVAKGDVQQQTNKQRIPQFFADGRPKFQMKVPLKNVMINDPSGQFVPCPDFPDGDAVFYVKGQSRDELTRAVTETGLPGDTPPQGGAVIMVTLVQRRPSGAGFQPANIVQIRYTPAPGSTPAEAAAAPPPPRPAPLPDPVAPYQPPAAAPQQQAPQYPGAPQQAQQPEQQYGAPAQAQPPAAAPQVGGLAPEQQAAYDAMEPGQKQLFAGLLQAQAQR